MFLSSSSTAMNAARRLASLTAAASSSAAATTAAPSLTTTRSRGMSSTTVAHLHAREILDSRGNPTVEVELTDSKGQVFLAAVPSGASTGDMEACELRDGDKSRYGGKGVLAAVANVTDKILPAIKGMTTEDIASIDHTMLELDGTKFKTNLGANAILGVSMAVCRAGAASCGEPLYQHINHLAGSPTMIMPVPCFNVINGGVHAGNFLAPQEFFLIPLGAPTFREALRMGAETYHVLKSLIEKKYGIESTAVGDEGGFAPNISTVEEAMDLLVEAIDIAGYTGQIYVGSDPAASEWYDKETDSYNFDFKRPLDQQDPSKVMKKEEVVKFWEEIKNKYPLKLLEDPFQDLDFEGHALMTATIGEDIEIVGDDLYCTNVEFVRKGVDLQATNAMLLKVNQIGTITESLKAFKMCQDNQWGVLVSHRSGETTDDFIADLTVGLGTGHLKTGAPCRGERLAKYNELLRIEERTGLGYAGYEFRNSVIFSNIFCNVEIYK